MNGRSAQEKYQPCVVDTRSENGNSRRCVYSEPTCHRQVHNYSRVSMCTCKYMHHRNSCIPHVKDISGNMLSALSYK